MAKKRLSSRIDRYKADNSIWAASLLKRISCKFKVPSRMETVPVRLLKSRSS